MSRCLEGTSVIESGDRITASNRLADRGGKMTYSVRWDNEPEDRFQPNVYKGTSKGEASILKCMAYCGKQYNNETQLLAVFLSRWIHNLDLCSNVRYYFKLHQRCWKIIGIDYLLKLPLKDQYYLRQLDFKVTVRFSSGGAATLAEPNSLSSTPCSQYDLMFWLNCHFV